MLKVMIAEDDLLMADLLEEVLIQGGYEVCGIARTVDEGVALDERCKPDLAILDVRLAAGGLGTDLAARLDRQGRPGVLYATGNAGQVRLTSADGEACLGKPYRPADIVRALEIVEQIVTTGTASQPFPKGFHLLQASVPRQREASSGAGKTRRPRDVERLLRQQAALARFGSFALAESDLGKVLTEAARVCAEGLDVPFCKVCRYRAEENDLLVEAGVGWHQGVVGCVVSRADESSPQGRAFVTGEPVICNDLNQDATFLLPSFYAEHGIISTLDVIIRKKDGQPYGVLEIDSPVQHNYDQHDVDFLTGFANVLAEAVDTFKRSRVLQGTVDRMKEMIAERDQLLKAKTLVLDEKNVLAQELQHRVRNNLQLVYGMLDKQLRATAEGAAKEGISAIARRVMTLSQVYDHLLGAGLSRTIDFGGYLSSLCESFKEMEDERRRQIQLVCRYEPLVLDLDTATALGLVIAELISNSYLHAFPAGIETVAGTISVTLHAAEPGGKATIRFVDDGVGFSEAGDGGRHGLGLVKRLMQQVDGVAQLTSDDGGTVWTLRFPVPATMPADGGILDTAA
ncbi:MAG: signal transduction histidine kinase [Rhodospirillales bacterium]|nr:signal transduction histidine kinase [Rhodospirillales bacterium]